MTINSVLWLGICILSGLAHTRDVRKVIFFEKEDFAGTNHTYEVDVDEKACIYTSGQQVRSAVLPEGVICQLSE